MFGPPRPPEEPSKKTASTSTKTAMAEQGKPSAGMTVEDTDDEDDVKGMPLDSTIYGY